MIAESDEGYALNEEQRGSSKLRHGIIGAEIVLFVISLMTLLPAPTFHAFIIRLAATEWGQWFALIALIFALLSAQFIPARLWIGKAASILGAISAMIFLLPSIRASAVARRLPEGLSDAFGPSTEVSSAYSPLRLFHVGYANVERSTLEYAPGLSGTLYEPVRATVQLPIVLAIHGGSWSGGGRDDFSRFDSELASRGAAVFTIDYRLAPRWKFPAALNDARSALQYLRKHASSLGADSNRIYVLGRSAGGEIAELLGYQERVSGVIGFYAPTDMVFAYSIPANPRVLDSRGILDAYMGGGPETASRAYQNASPMRFVSRTAPPTLLIHGRTDELVWPIHERRLMSLLNRFHRPAYYLELPWATHGCDINPSGPCGQLSLFAIDWLIHAKNR